MEKRSVSRLSYLFAHLYLLSSYSFSSDLLSSSLPLLSASALLCFSSLHMVGSLTSKLPSIINYSSELSSEFLPDSISSTQSPFDIGVLVDAVLAESSYFGATRSEHAQTRQENFQDLITHLREGRSLGNTYLQSYARHGIEQFDYTGYIYSMPDGIRIPTLQEHYIDAQDQTPLPIWRPEAYFKYPDGPELDEEEILRLLELFRSCLLGKRAVQGVVKRTKDNIHEFQRDTYQLGILTLNLGHINRLPYNGGCSKFPKWVRTDIKYRVLPHLVFRNAAHM